MPWNRGYIPPGELPGGFVCRVIWIPDSPRCVEAAWDAYTRLSSPGQWMTDYAYASAISQVWQTAIIMSLNTWDNGEDCMISQSVVDDIIARLEELENMNICVNCGCSCANGGQSGTVINDDTVPPGQNPPEPTQPTPTDEIWLCNVSYDAPNRYVQFWQEVKNHAGNLSASVLQTILEGLVVFFGFGATFSYMLTLINQYIAQGLADLEISMFTTLSPAITSAIQTATSSAQAKAAVQNLVWSANYSWFVRAAGWALVSLADWDMLFTENSYQVPSSPQCEDMPPPGTCWLPVGYAVQKANQYVQDTGSQYTVSQTLTPDAGSDECGTTSLANYTALLDATNQTWEVVLRALYLQEVNEAIGYCITVMFNEAIGGNSPAIPVARVSFSLESSPPPYYSFDEYAVFRFVAVKPAHMGAFQPLVGGVVGELQQITENDWDFETQSVYHKLYKRSGVSNNQFGSVGISIKFQYIYPL